MLRGDVREGYLTFDYRFTIDRIKKKIILCQ